MKNKKRNMFLFTTHLCLFFHGKCHGIIIYNSLFIFKNKIIIATCNNGFWQHNSNCTIINKNELLNFTG